MAELRKDVEDLRKMRKPCVRATFEKNLNIIEKVKLNNLNKKLCSFMTIEVHFIIVTFFWMGFNDSCKVFFYLL